VATWARCASCTSGVNILTLGILNEAVQRWYGRTESVMAMTALFVPRRTDPESGQLQDVDIPDSVTVLARMATGAQCVYHVSGHAHHAGGPRIEAYGSDGTLVYDLAEDTIHGAKAGDAGLAPIEIPDSKRGGWRVEDDFCAAIRGERPVTMTSFRDGLKYMSFTEAVRLSAETGRQVSLGEL
jgi:predicted dehydrogenase